MKFSPPLLACAAIPLACGFLSATSRAEEASNVFSKEPSATRGPVGVTERPRPAYDAGGLRYGGFVFYPSILASVSFNDNMFATRLNPKHDVINTLTPMLRAEGNFGTTKIGAYVSAESRLHARFTGLNMVAPSVGVGGKTEITRDLVVQGRADYAYKAEDPAETGAGNGIRLGRHVRYHDFSTSGSVNQNFGRAFVSVGGAFQRLVYQDSLTATGALAPQQQRNNNLFKIVSRAGYEFGPGLKAFFEPSVNWKRYENQANLNSNGYRLVGGVSTEMFRLLTGEVYAGYMSQRYLSATGPMSGFTAGVQAKWYPTNLLTVAVNADRTIQESGATSLLNPSGAPLFVTTVGLRTDYELLRNFILSGLVTFTDNDYRLTGRHVKNTVLGATATYMFNRMLVGSLDYRRLNSASTVAADSYNRNVVTASIKGQF